MGFQIAFNILKIRKILKTDWPNIFFPTTTRITKATMMHHLTPKKVHIDGSIFFQNPYCWFILDTFGQAWLNQQLFPEILAISYFRALWTLQACLTTPKNNFMIKLQLPWISYYMQKVNFLSQITFKILKF